MIGAPFARGRYRLRRLASRAVRTRSLSTLASDWRTELRDDYSLAPFLRTNSLFVHIPKCAGVSICRALYGNLAGGHMTMREYELAFSPRELACFFTFTCVRNPWDRLLSSYDFLVGGGFNARDAAWSARHLAAFPTFEHFVMEGLGEPAIMAYVHFRPQAGFLRGRKSAPAVDFVAYFEHLAQDFAVLRDRVNPLAVLPVLNRHRAAAVDFRRAFTTAMIERTAQVYREDIDLLGYAFDNASLDAQLRRRAVS